MQQQDVAGCQSSRQPAEDGIGIAVNAVEAPPRPGDELQAGAMHGVVEQGVAKPHRGAEEDRRGARRLLDCLARGSDLAGEAAGQGQGEAQRVRVRVILDAVARRRISRVSAGSASTRSPMQKKLALAP